MIEMPTTAAKALTTVTELPTTANKAPTIVTELPTMATSSESSSSKGVDGVNAMASDPMVSMLDLVTPSMVSLTMEQTNVSTAKLITTPLPPSTPQVVVAEFTIVANYSEVVLDEEAFKAILKKQVMLNSCLVHCFIILGKNKFLKFIFFIF